MYTLEQQVSILEMQKSSYYMELEFTKTDLSKARKKIEILEKCLNEFPIYTSKLGYKYNIHKDIWENEKLRWLPTFQLVEIICKEFEKTIK